MKKNKIVILSPFEGDFWTYLKDGIEDAVLLQPLAIKNNIFRYLCSNIKSIFFTSKNDIIVCPYDFQSIILWHLCRYLFIKRRIVGVNLLLKDKQTFLNKIVKYLYKKAIRAENFRICVTSKEYGNYINKVLDTNVNFPLIHDVNYDFYEFKSVLPKQSNTVFCGGRNGRDWNFMIHLAKRCPNVSFIFVCPNYIYDKIKNSVGENIYLYKDVTFKEFGELMTSCSIVCLPLETEAPAGLMVLFQAASSHRFVITTNTATTREYIKHEINGLLLDNNIDLWVNALREKLEKSEECDKMAEGLRSYLIQNCSKQQYIDGIRSMIASFH